MIKLWRRKLGVIADSGMRLLLCSRLTCPLTRRLERGGWLKR